MKIKKKLIALDEIKIPGNFAKSKPRAWKMNECRKFYKKHGVQDRYIVLNKENYCVDGYIMYLTLKKEGEHVAEVVYSQKDSKFYRKTKWQIFKSKVRKALINLN